MPAAAATAALLLDAQVDWVLAQLRGDRLRVTVEREVDALLARSDEVRLADVITPTTATAIVEAAVAAATRGGAAVVASRHAVDLVHDRTVRSLRPADVVRREDVGALLDALAAFRPVLAELLDRATSSPAVGTLATRFVTQIVVDVLELNRSLTRRIPGVGSIVSLGTTAATRVVGAADRQVQALLGDTAGRGAALIVRRLNAVVLATIDDPLLRVAALEVWDSHATEPLDGLAGLVDRDDVGRLVDVLRRIAASAGSAPPALAVVEEWTRSLLDDDGDRPIAEVLDDLSFTRDDLVGVATAVVRPLVEAGLEHGWIEQEVRNRLAPFYATDVVAQLLDADRST